MVVAKVHPVILRTTRAGPAAILALVEEASVEAATSSASGIPGQEHCYQKADTTQQDLQHLLIPDSKDTLRSSQDHVKRLRNQLDEAPTGQI